MSPEQKEKFETYIDRLKTQQLNKVEIIENLKDKIKLSPRLRERLEKTQIKALGNIRKRAEEKGIKCPLNMINPMTCKGRIVTKKAPNGCPIIKCVPKQRTYNKQIKNPMFKDIKNNAPKLRFKNKPLLNISPKPTLQKPNTGINNQGGTQ